MESYEFFMFCNYKQHCIDIPNTPKQSRRVTGMSGECRQRRRLFSDSSGKELHLNVSWFAFSFVPSTVVEVECLCFAAQLINDLHSHRKRSQASSFGEVKYRNTHVQNCTPLTSYCNPVQRAVQFPVHAVLLSSPYSLLKEAKLLRSWDYL